MSPKKSLWCTEAPTDGLLGSPGTGWVFSFLPLLLGSLIAFPSHRTYKPTLYQFKADERPFFSFIFTLFFN